MYYGFISMYVLTADTRLCDVGIKRRISFLRFWMKIQYWYLQQMRSQPYQPNHSRTPSGNIMAIVIEIVIIYIHIFMLAKLRGCHLRKQNWTLLLPKRNNSNVVCVVHFGEIYIAVYLFHATETNLFFLEQPWLSMLPELMKGGILQRWRKFCQRETACVTLLSVGMRHE
jgi:hypothetical protein